MKAHVNCTGNCIVGFIEEGRSAILMHSDNFFVIANNKDAADLKVGDRIEYESFGLGFGLFIKKL